MKHKRSYKDMIEPSTFKKSYEEQIRDLGRIIENLQFDLERVKGFYVETSDKYEKARSKNRELCKQLAEVTRENRGLKEKLKAFVGLSGTAD